MAAAALVAVALLMSGCGPVQSTQRIGEAEVAFERARVVEAHQKAPYEYYSANHYLHKSKEEWGYSDFEASYDYATDAKRAAEAAILKAKEDPWEGSPAKKSQNQTDQATEGSDAAPAQDSPTADPDSPSGY